MADAYVERASKLAAASRRRVESLCDLCDLCVEPFENAQYREIETLWAGRARVSSLYGSDQVRTSTAALTDSRFDRKWHPANELAGSSDFGAILVIQRSACLQDMNVFAQDFRS